MSGYKPERTGLIMAVHEVKLKIQEESDLFSPLDPDQDMLSEEVATHFERTIENLHIKKKDSFVIRIFTDTPVNEENIKKKIRNHLSRQRDIIKRDLRSLILKEICLAIFGAAVLAVWLYLSARTENVSVEILSIIGWVAVWEATSIVIMEHPRLHRSKIEFEHLLSSEIIVSEQTAQQNP